jgi:hypothetical protein
LPQAFGLVAPEDMPTSQRNVDRAGVGKVRLIEFVGAGVETCLVGVISWEVTC